MSMEQAIIELAAAIRYAADRSNGTALATFAAGAPLVKTAEGVHGSVAKVEATAKDPALETAVTKVEDDAKAQQKAAMAAAEADRKAALAAAKKEPAKAPEDDPLAGAAELDWAKDVRPVLLQVGKNRDQLVALLEKYGVPKGGVADADKRPALLAEAEAILTARG